MVNEIGRDGQFLINGFKSFYSALYGGDFDYENLEEFKKYKTMVHEFLLQGYDDFDVEIFVSYQVEPTRNKKPKIQYKQCMSICDIAERGISLPSDVTKLTIKAKPVIRNRENGLVAKTILKKSEVFSKTIILSRYEINNADAGKNVDVPENVQVLDPDDFKENSTLFRFVDPKEVIM